MCFCPRKLKHDTEVGFNLGLAHIEHFVRVEPGAGEQPLRLANWL